MSLYDVLILVGCLSVTNASTGFLAHRRTHKKNYEARHLPTPLKRYPSDQRPIEGSIWHGPTGETYIVAGDEWKLLP